MFRNQYDTVSGRIRHGSSEARFCCNWARSNIYTKFVRVDIGEKSEEIEQIERKNKRMKQEIEETKRK